MHSAFNWLVELFRDIIDKINDQGEILAFIVTKLGEILDNHASKDLLKEKHDALEKDLIKRCEEMEQKCENLRNEAAVQPDMAATKEELQQKHDDLEKNFAQKCDALERKYDEVRQRGLKGNLIVSSPNITARNGRHIPSLAEHRSDWDRHGNWRKENDLEMVLRLVHMKTGIWIEEKDVIACHPLGRRERNTFILSVNNRAPDSAWDIISTGMVTGDKDKIFNKENVFINFQLTKRRGEICKEVRRAKKENLIKNYDIDANGKIFVKELGDEKKTVQISDLETIRKYFPVNT